MVSYQRWTAIVFDVARSKGANTDRQETNQSIVQAGAQVWRERKAHLSTATVEEARQIAIREISVA